MANGAYAGEPAQAGQQTSRVSIRAVLVAGVLAGAAFLLMEYIIRQLGVMTPLGPAHTISALMNVEPESGSSRFLILILFIHFGLALLTTFVLGLAIHRMPLHLAGAAGFVYGAILYALSFFILAFAAPRLNIPLNFLLMLVYALYGTIAAGLYKWQQPA